MAAGRVRWREPLWSMLRQCERGGAATMQHAAMVRSPCRGHDEMGVGAAGKPEERVRVEYSIFF
jgi:hypothetical protein